MEGAAGRISRDRSFRVHEGGGDLSHPVEWSHPLQLFRGNPLLLDEDVSGLTGVRLRVAPGAQLGEDGFPFFLDAQGQYLADVNSFLLELATRGVHASNSRWAYAIDLNVWFRFLWEALGKRSPWLATGKDIAVYQQIRHGDNAENPIARSTWNRSIAGLDHFYDYGVREGLIEAAPFLYRHVRTPYGSSKRNLAKEPESPRSVRFLSRFEFSQFVHIGICGAREVGGDWNDKLLHIRADLAVAYLLATTGLRIAEALATLFDEPGIWKSRGGLLPVPAHLRKHGLLPVEARIHPAAAKAIREYVQLERTLSVANSDRANFGITRPLQVMEPENGRFRELGRGGQRKLHSLTGAERRRLVVFKNDGTSHPGLLFLNVRGGPLRYEAVYRRFLEANRRLKEAGIDLYVTPHDLRHTYAVHRLHELVVQWLENNQSRGESLDPGTEMYRRVAEVEPLRTLQRELGHHRYTSCLAYLEPSLPQAEFAWAVRSWERGLEGLS